MRGESTPEEEQTVLEELNAPRGYAARRMAEDLVAGYLSQRASRYDDIVNRLCGCRRHGTIAKKADGARVWMWDQKCGINRLCPDEAREEQQRLKQRYKPAIMAWAKAPSLTSYRRRVQYSVLTWPNIPRGRLAFYKREMFKRLSRWLKLPELKGIKGTLAGQEDPLSRDGDWNLHVNLLLLVEGKLDWTVARAKWFEITRDLFESEIADKALRSFSVHFEQLDASNGDDLDHALAELIKYPAKSVTEDMLRPGWTPDEIDPEAAPPLVLWPMDAFDEWWDAGYHQPSNTPFRRTRSYGILLAIHGLHWNLVLRRQAKEDMLAKAEADQALAGALWRKIPKETREKLAPLILPDEEPLGELEYIGRCHYDAGAKRYSVNLIPAYNSGIATPRNNASDPGGWGTGPPDWGGRGPQVRDTFDELCKF